MSHFRRLIDVHVKGAIACVESMCLLRESVKTFDSDYYDCMNHLCEAFAHYADQITIFVKESLDELPEMPEE